jgi:hypothetical protein
MNEPAIYRSIGVAWLQSPTLVFRELVLTACCLFLQQRYLCYSRNCLHSSFSVSGCWSSCHTMSIASHVDRLFRNHRHSRSPHARPTQYIVSCRSRISTVLSPSGTLSIRCPVALGISIHSMASSNGYRRCQASLEILLFTRPDSFGM